MWFRSIPEYVHDLLGGYFPLKEVERSFGLDAYEPVVQDWIDRLLATEWAEAKVGLMTKYHTAATRGTTAPTKPQPALSLHGIPPGMRNKIATANPKTAPKNAPAHMRRRGRLHRPSGFGCMACLQPPCRATMTNAATMRLKPMNPTTIAAKIGTMLQFMSGTRFRSWFVNQRPAKPESANPGE